MSKFNYEKKQQTIDKHALTFGLISVFLIGVGFSIITPVIPFLVAPYIKNSANQAMVVTLLISVYALCMFFSAPVLGALSDRYGRRPLLLISLLGSAVGFLVFGLGGALWILFAGRIIEGITGGSISTIFAYFADITSTEERTKYFGWVSAVAGVGSIMGPTIGGLIAGKFGYAAPLHFGANISLLNFVYDWFLMPESLDKSKRLQEITFGRINPFVQLASVLSIKNLKWVFISAFLLWIPSGSLQGILSQFTIDTFQWKPALIGLVFSIMGFQDLFSQGLIMPRLITRFSDKQIVVFGMTAEIFGYILMAASSFFTNSILFIVGMFIFSFGDSIFGPAYNGLISKSVNGSEQGRVQGGSQSIQALARIIGPVVGGVVYVSVSHAAPAIMGVILVAMAILILAKKK